MQGNSPFNNELFRDWFFSSFSRSEEYPLVLFIGGAGPFDESDFTVFLKSHGFEVFDIEAPDSLGNFFGSLKLLVNTVIVGGNSESWPDSKLKKLEHLIDLYAGETLKIYSQEMFLSFMATGQDVFDDSRDRIKQFGAGNYVLEYLSSLGFNWPSTLVIFGDGPFSDEPWPQTGLLGYMGYHVGHSGIQDAKERRNILKKIFTSHLPSVNSPSYMAEWESPNSSKRLKKMADSIATFCKNDKRKESLSYALAIAHRESDLDWLYNEYYHGHFTFIWPSTNVY